MSDQPKRVTIMSIGQTGAGKSAFGNLYLKKITFEASSDPQSCTLNTSSSENLVNEKLRTYIDTQGLDDTKGLDDAHVTQMVDFLRNWEGGVNAIGIVINGQSPRFDQGTRRLMKLIHNFFNDNNIWNLVFLVFTKWYKGIMKEKQKASALEYVKEVRNLANECIGYNANPQIPCFFVDAKEDLSELDDDTQQELIQINAFAYGKDPVSTKGFKVPDINYFKIIKEDRKDYLLSEEINEKEMTRTRKYADQTRNKQISYNNVVSYSDWVNVKTREKVDKKTIKEEIQERVKVSNSSEPKFRIKKGRRPILGILGRRRRYRVLDHTEVTTTYEDRKRSVITDYDNNVSYGEWETIRTYTELTRT